MARRWWCSPSASCRSTRAAPGRPRRRPGRRRPTSSGSGCGRRASTSTARWSTASSKACADRGVHLAIGVNEREDDRPGSLYNTLLVLGPEGLLHRHRKLMPTMHERVFHGVGAGDDLDVVDLPGVGRVGGLICWENRMPLARWRVYEGGPQIWLAPTADDSDGWIASMRHIAIEAGAFVVSVPQYIPALGLPGRLPARRSPSGVEVLGRGGACVVSPTGDVIAGPLYDEEGIVVADCDLARGAPRQALLRRGGPLRPSRRARPP